MNTPWHASLKAINFVFLAALLGFLFSPIEANAKDDVRFSSREHGQALALMDAAASGSLAMIRLLPDSGSGPSLKDSRGLKAIDYLKGQESFKPKTRLAPGELSRARLLLSTAG